MIFDPIYITFQIIALQCSYYVVMGSIYGLFYAFFQHPISLDHFFTSDFINFTTYGGWTDIGCVFLSGLVGSYLLFIVVERSKKCVDFTFTLYFLHILICTIFKEFPLQWEWWLTHVVSSVVMASLGEYYCARAELEDIPLSSHI